MYHITFRWRGFPSVHTAYVTARSPENAVKALLTQWDTTGKMVVESVRQAEEGVVIVVG